MSSHVPKSTCVFCNCNSGFLKRGSLLVISISHAQCIWVLFFGFLLIVNKLKRNSNLVQKDSGIASVFSEVEPTIKRLLRRMLPDRHSVDDITQETVLRALQAEKKRTIEQPKAYLFRIARNLVKDELEKKSRSIIEFIDEYGPETSVEIEPSVEESYENRQRMLLFGEALASLPRQCRQVFILKKVYGYSHKEISKKLSISISTTEKHVVSGLKRCQEFVKVSSARNGKVLEGPVSRSIVAKNKVESSGDEK